MATFTALGLVGHAHPNNEGIIPTHRLYLSENGRPAWILLHESLSRTNPGRTHGKITWIPTLENMLEDGLLMLSIHVLQDPALIELAREYLRTSKPDYVTLYDHIDPDNLDRLYAQSRALEHRYKLALMVLEGSTIRRQLNVLEHYRMDVEVCTPRYSRLHSRLAGLNPRHRNSLRNRCPRLAITYRRTGL